MGKREDDQSVLSHIDQLVKEESGCTRRRLTEEDQARLGEVKWR